MQILIGLVIVIAMCWPLIKFLIGMPYGIPLLIIAIIIWRACLK